VTAGAVLAVNNFGDTRSGGLAGPMALLIIVLLAIATVLLIRNMNSRLRRLPERFPDQPAPSRSGSPGAPADGPDPRASDFAQGDDTGTAVGENAGSAGRGVPTGPPSGAGS
jgi:predicted lipid-binding transport protein (Tim44 family)